MNPASRFACLVFSCALLLVATGTASAQSRTFTDKDGRSMKAELVGGEGDRVRIKREDGQTFLVNPTIFSDADQQVIAKFLEEEAKKIPAGAIRLEYSRGKFNSTKQPTESTIRIEEEWGYTITLKSEISKPIENIRVEYILFVRPDDGPKSSTSREPLRREPGSHVVKLLPLRESINFRTSSIRTARVQLRPGWVWSETMNRNEIRDTLHGVWIKVYVGDKLITEACNPESLAKSEQW